MTAASNPKLDQFLDLLLAANATMNLTRIVDREQARILHIEDSMTLLPFLPEGSIRIADVGSGGGVPGIILAIVRPDAQVTLIESTGKKAAFCQSAAAELGLTNVKVLSHRAEDAGRGKSRESFDIVVARALGQMIWLVEWCLPLAKVGGKFLAMKGPKVQEELPPAAAAIRKLGGGKPVIHPAAIAGAEGHVIVEIPKTGPTPAQFPRLPSFAKGKPMR